MKLGKLLAAVMAIIAGANITHADDNAESLPVVAPKVKSLAAFKNGVAFVFKSAETPLKNGWTRMDQLPPAALGTLWIGTTSKSGPVTDVVAYKEKVAIDADSVSLPELLAANAGRQVSITYVAGANSKTVDGVLLSSPTPHKPDENEITPVGQPSPYASGWRPPLEPANAEIVLLRGTKAGGAESTLLALNLNSIQSVEISGDANPRTKLERELARTKIRVGGQPARAEITVACLEKGIVWSPSYRINLADEKTAAIELEAVLADDQEDLDNADVSFVVGYPNFLFADMLTPMSLQQSVAAFVQSLLYGAGERNRAGGFANVMNQAVAYNNLRSDVGGAPDAGYSVATAPPGEQNEDLYLYRKSGVNLKKGDRARFSLLSTTAPYEHIFQWQVGDTMNLDERGYRNNEQPKPEDLVWHVLRLKNTGQTPWTTAPALAINDALPVAQDTLTYTPPGGKSTLKLTVATDVRAEQSQTESSRRQLKIAGREFDEVSVAGKLVLTNWKHKEITMLVRKSLVGEVLESPDGKVSKVARNLTAVNSTSEIEWEFKLPAGQTRELTYQYKVLLNR
ncbi:MAG TPA: hypothetical protein VK731_11255 [Candidatus Cybelea sp.]|jgi:hypothetical protein|nr:hypothetical protein [Candidatus Cybelea sp.]